MHLPVHAVVLAAGAGRRFGQAKQFADIAGVRAVDRVVAVAARHSDDVLVVVPPHANDDLLRSFDAHDVTLVPGGATRARSASAGIGALPEGDAVIVIADAAHPLAGDALYEAIIAAVRAGAPAAAPVRPAAQTIAQVEDGRVVRVFPRHGHGHVQTPLAFRAPVLRRLYAMQAQATDEVALAVANGVEVTVVAGAATNVHVVTREDLEIVRHLLGAVE